MRTESHHIETLCAEIQRYLEAVALFRELGLEPCWRTEQPSSVVARVNAWLEPHERGVSRA